MYLLYMSILIILLIGSGDGPSIVCDNDDIYEEKAHSCDEKDRYQGDRKSSNEELLHP